MPTSTEKLTNSDNDGLPFKSAQAQSVAIVKRILRQFVPTAVRKIRQDLRLRRWRQKALGACAGLSVEETFETVYAKQLWGGEGSHQFYSGGGSDIEYAGRYCEFVRQFIRDREIKSVVDVGCGDFRVGRNLLVPGTSYTGIDVAQTLIDRNTREFSREEVKFVAINAIEQVPPSANLCLIRQVLQHLSNAQILDILRNCRSFRYLLVSDHLFPNHPGPFNVDKPHGPDTRESGIRLDLPPFKMETQIMLEVEVGQGEMIRTVLIERKLA